MLPKVVGKRIRNIRIGLGLNMEDFGKLFNPQTNKGVVSNWEAGKNKPNNERLKRIAELGGITVAELLDETDILSLVDENKLLRLALEFYADRKNHQVIWYDTPSTVGFDSGETARQALKACNFKYKEGE